MRVPSDLKNELRGAKVIVTGASGFIGLNMVRVLSDLGAEVTVIDRIQPAERLPQVQFEWADLRHLDKVYEADYLIHLAAITNAGYAERYPLDTYEVNVLGTANLMDHVRIEKRVLFPSTALTYQASGPPISEDAETDLYERYIEQRMTDAHPSNCNACHLSGIDLEMYIQDTPCQSMACMNALEVVDFDDPEASEALGQIIIKSTDELLDLFDGHIYAVPFRHDVHRLMKDRTDMVMVVVELN